MVHRDHMMTWVVECLKSMGGERLAERGFQIRLGKLSSGTDELRGSFIYLAVRYSVGSSKAKKFRCS